MANDELVLDPGRAHRAGMDLVHAGKAIVAQRNGLGNEIAAASAGRPWGRDDIGAAFEQKYRGFEATVLKAWLGTGGYLEQLGADVVRSVTASVETDNASGRRIGDTAR